MDKTRKEKEPIYILYSNPIKIVVLNPNKVIIKKVLIRS